MVIVDYQPNMTTESSTTSTQACLNITVVIPTYNGAERLPQVLDRLKQQIAIDDLQWEVIVCDNNSCDRTANVVTEYQNAWLDQISLRYCFVAEQGAAFARQRGVEEACGQIVAFLDDDNLPALDWLTNVYQFAEDYPRAGAFGSQIHGDFQGALPKGFGDIACFLAIVERGSKPHLYDPKSKILPPAAGVAVRRKAWLESVPDRLFLNHKGKSAGLASEDLEAMLHIQKAGWEVWYNSDMVVTHQIPETRLQQEYLVALLRCIGLSRFYIRWLGTKEWQRLFKVPAYIANDLRKLAFYYLKHRSRKTPLDTVAACEQVLLISTIVSPVFLLRKASKDVWQAWRDNVQLPERQKWLRRLTDTFEERQLELYQQAVIDLGSENSLLDTTATSLPQFEILLRLRRESSENQPVSPASFFPTAERYGLMRTLDRRVVQQVCETLRERPLQAVYSVNLSTASVTDPSFASFLENQLQRNRVKPESLCCEVPASTVINNWPLTKYLIERMKSLGIRVAIDDVLDCSICSQPIHTLLVDCLKLGKTIAASSDSSREQNTLLMLVQFSQENRIQLVAKGVETQSDLDSLKSLGIEYFQGYQLSTPVPFPHV
ncbi:MAG: hormogonium polysaccharide biosynthesis glycosyltransferase HpsE [Cyanobacteria bacterium P01_D01_bin.56]